MGSIRHLDQEFWIAAAWVCGTLTLMSGTSYGVSLAGT